MAFLMYLVLAFITLIIVAYYKSKIRKYKDIDKLPGPSLIQLIRGLYFDKDGALNYLQTINEKYGPVAKVWIKPFKPAIVTTDLRYIEKVFYANNLYTPSFKVLEPYLREGLATVPSAQKWKRDRRIISRSMNKDYVASKFQLYDEKISDCLNTIKEQQGEPMDVQDLFLHLVLDISMNSLRDPNVSLTQEDIRNYHNMRCDFFDSVLKLVNAPFLDGIYQMFTGYHNIYRERGEKLVKCAEDFLELHYRVDRRLRGDHNLIYAMLNGGIAQERVVDNINTLLQAGDDAIGLTLAFSFLELAKHPDLQQKVYEEVVSILGSDPECSVLFDDLQAMPYLHYFVKETLRLHHVLTFVDRLLAQDIEIDDITIPKGTTVMVPFPAVQKSEKYFKNPLRFDPDRFLPENIDPLTAKAFCAFGLGVKSCPGKLIGYTIVKLLIVKAIRCFEVLPVKGFEVEMQEEVIIRSSNGVLVIFKNRESK